MLYNASLRLSYKSLLLKTSLLINLLTLPLQIVNMSLVTFNYFLWRIPCLFWHVWVQSEWPTVPGCPGLRGFLAHRTPYAKTGSVLGKLRQLVTLALWYHFTLVGLEDRSQTIQTLARECLFSESFLRCSLKDQPSGIIWSRVVLLHEINNENTDGKLLSVFFFLNWISFPFLLSSSKISIFHIDRMECI